MKSFSVWRQDALIVRARTGACCALLAVGCGGSVSGGAPGNDPDAGAPGPTVDCHTADKCTGVVAPEESITVRACEMRTQRFPGCAPAWYRVLRCIYDHRVCQSDAGADPQDPACAPLWDGYYQCTAAAGSDAGP
jgi:hypothetical protein